MSTTHEDLDCDELVELVTDYLEGAMSPVDRARFDHHLTECDGCEVYLARIRAVTSMAHRLEGPVIEPPMRTRLLAAFRTWKRP